MLARCPIAFTELSISLEQDINLVPKLFLIFFPFFVFCFVGWFYGNLEERKKSPEIPLVHNRTVVWSPCLSFLSACVHFAFTFFASSVITCVGSFHRKSLANHLAKDGPETVCVFKVLDEYCLPDLWKEATHLHLCNLRVLISLSS